VQELAKKYETMEKENEELRKELDEIKALLKK
jgi:hypothetical protein